MTIPASSVASWPPPRGGPAGPGGPGWAVPAPAPPAVPEEPPLRPVQVLALLGLHVLLGLVAKPLPLLATAHALGTVALGVYWVMGQRTPERVIYLLGYLAGAEVLWRGAHALVFWEFGKYAVVLIAGLALVRFRLLAKMPKAPLLYFLLLVPGIFVMPGFDRNMISFNLSGPLTLAAATAFLGTQHLDLMRLKKLALVTIAPTLSLAAIATSATLAAEELHFGGSSKITSGGIGPNQVSATLALGAMMAVIFLLVARRERILQLAVGTIGLWLAAQSALTFSRGGMLTTLGALAVGCVLLLGDRKSRGLLLLRGGLMVLVAVYLLYPALNAATDGALGRRFADPSTTGRDRLVKADLIAFRENPLFGAGLGQSKQYHALTFGLKATHTEYTRLLAEHGSFGLLALLLLAGMTLQRLRRPVPLAGKALALTFTAWALLFLAHSAMRIVAPCLLFGLGAAYLWPDATGARPRPGVAPAWPVAPGPLPGPPSPRLPSPWLAGGRPAEPPARPRLVPGAPRGEPPP